MMAAFDDLFTAALRGVFGGLGKKHLAQTQGQVSLPELTAPSEILHDRWGIPHIYAQNEHDVWVTQGFVHAQERLWQMELNRRTAEGRLAELFGALALDTDRAARTFGFARCGRADLERLSQPVREMIQAYVDGINACIRLFPHQLPLEFSLIGYKPEPWTIENTLSLSRLMFWQLSHAWYGEIIRARLIQAVGEEHAAELEVCYPKDNPSTLPDGVEFNRFGPNGLLQAERGPFLQRGMGSNEWAVTGSRTASGAPILCNDMHMVLSIPLLWYFNHLETPTLHVTGESVPGLPMVLVGHNDRLAWGMTLAYTDCVDLFIEKFDPADETRYEFCGEMHQAEVYDEVIRVKGQAQPHIEQVRVTRHGPVVSAAVGYPAQTLALQDPAFRPCNSIEGWLILNHARDWDDFVRAVQQIDSPQLSIAYADVDGNIGYWITGRTPIRAKGNGLVPVPGWTGEYEWRGEIPFDEMPHAFNPQKGYVVNTNNKVIGDDYPYYLGSIWMNGYRARRLTEMLESYPKLDADGCAAMQTDVTCLPGRQFVELLQDFTSSDEDVLQALDLLRGWDGQLTPDTVGGTVYEVARYTLVRRLLEPGLGKPLTDDVLGVSFNAVLYPDHEYYGHDTLALLRMLANPDSWWVKRAGGLQTVLEGALGVSIEWLRDHLGANPAGWQWGRIHRLTLNHAIGMQKPLDRVFNRGPFPIGGDTDTPWQTAMTPSQAYDNTLFSPSMRHIIDLGDLSRSLFILPVGNSGQLGSPHYDDHVEDWRAGRYQPMLWTREQVEANMESRLVLNK